MRKHCGVLKTSHWSSHGTKWVNQGQAGMGFSLMLKSLDSVLSAMEIVHSVLRQVVHFHARDYLEIRRKDKDGPDTSTSLPGWVTELGNHPILQNSIPKLWFGNSVDSQENSL